MQKITLFFLLFTFFSLSFSSCSKYEEGSKFTLLTKKQRMVNNWKMKKLTANGDDITSLNIITEIDIRDNGTITVRGAFFGVPTSDDGHWIFDNDKSHLVITNQNGGVDRYEIIRLKDKELKVKITTNGTEYLHEYEEK